MDLTTTCPTCGHVEDASSSTCSFCGVELGLNSEPVQAADAHPAADQDSGVEKESAEELSEELLLQSVSPAKPESVDEAIAHVLSAEDEEEPLELVDEIEIEPEGEEKVSEPEKAPEAMSKKQEPVPPPTTSEQTPAERVVLSMPVQLKAEASEQAADEAPEPAPVETPAAAAAPYQKVQALKEHRAAMARAEALKKKKMAIARVIALKKKKAALKQMQPLEAGVRLQKLLKKYVGKRIGINYDNSAKIASAELIEVNNEHLTVAVESKKLHYHFPLATVLSIIEGASDNGVPTGAGNEVFDAVVKIYPLVLF